MCCLLQEWEKLNYDIHTLRYAQREVRSRWKKILLLLGEDPHTHTKRISDVWPNPMGPTLPWMFHSVAILAKPKDLYPNKVKPRL